MLKHDCFHETVVENFYKKNILTHKVECCGADRCQYMLDGSQLSNFEAETGFGFILN